MLLGLLLEHRDELVADDLALLLGVGDAGERVEEPLLRRRSRAGRRGSDRGRSPRPARARLSAAGRCRRRCRSSRSPIALWISAAATDESTPPERPQMTRPSLADLRADLRDRLVDEATPSSSRPSRRRCRTGSCRAARRRARVCTTSGWNCTQWILRAAFANADISQFSRLGGVHEARRDRVDVVAVRRPDARAPRLPSPCGTRPRRPASRARPRGRTRACPPGATLPPSSFAVSCAP